MRSFARPGPLHSRRRPLIAAIATLLIAAPLSACTATTPDPEHTPRSQSAEGKLLDEVAVPQLKWTDCEDGFECTTATVPLDYDEPKGEQIELSLVRLPASDPEQRIGSLFTNPGGPGLPGVGVVRRLAPTTFPQAVRDRLDIIGLDPRGAGQSTPVQCFDDPAKQQLTLGAITSWPADDADRVELDAAIDLLAEQCELRSGALLDHTSTADVARDLEMLRRAVGDEQLTYHGLSYGTYIGATYASLFPDRVRAVVLDGMLDPASYTGTDAPDGSVPWLRVGNDLATDDVLDQFFELCAGAGQACPLGVDGDPKEKFDELLSALDETPLVISDPTYGDFEIRGADISLKTQTMLASPRSWAGQAVYLYELHTRLFGEDPDAALAYYLEVLAAEAAQADEAVEQAYVPPGGAAVSNQFEAYLANLCVDTEHPGDINQFAAAAAEARQRAPYSADRWAWVIASCASWTGVAEDRYTGPFTPTTAEPVLVVGNRHDPNTAYRSAADYAEELPSAGLLTLEGWGHTASFQGYSTCIDVAVAAYLIDGTMPPAGTTCDPDPAGVPFTVIG